MLMVNVNFNKKNMKKNLIIVIYIAYHQILFPQMPANDKSWEIVFQDYFTNESIFNSVWWSGAYNTNTGIHPDKDTCVVELQAYERASIVYKPGGGLSLVSAKQNVLRKASRWQPDNEILCDGKENLRWFHYTSGGITTQTRYGYGYFEIKCKIPKGLGYWPAFWMHMEMQEIDIVEPSGKNSEACLIYGANVYQPDNCPLIECKSQFDIKLSIDLSLTYHTYSIEWTPNLVIFYLDNVPVRVVNGAIVPNIPMHVIANLAICPWYQPLQPFSAKSLDIEYIKIYALKKNCAEEVIASNFDFNTHNYSLKKLYRLSNSVVPVGAKVSLRATNEIELKEGFEVSSGAEFNAIITKCH